MAFWNLVPAGLSGAGYDDQFANNDANNNAYRDTVGGGEKDPGCDSVEHRGMKFEFTLQVWQMQGAVAIDYIYGGICGVGGSARDEFPRRDAEISAENAF